MENQNKMQTIEREGMEHKMQAKKPQCKKLLWMLVGVLAILLVVAVFVLFQVGGEKPSEPEVDVISTLQKVVDISELSTFTAIYNGVAQVQNEKKPEKTDYYVSYKAEVKAGFDFQKIEFSRDDANQTIKVKIPEISIIGVYVDIASLDFIFVNDKANASAVTEQAFKACEDDVQMESEQQEAIYNLAKQNAENVLRALMNPLLKQLDTDYTLVME